MELQKVMRNMGEYRLSLLVGLLSIAIFSSSILVMLPAALTDQEQQSAFATFPGENGKIAFVRYIGNQEVYVMNADGSEQINISNERFDDAYPDWSADGTKITFASARPSSGTAD